MRYIYILCNKMNWKTYVGQSKNPISRVKGHFSAAHKGVKRRVYDAIRKHGKENFDFFILEACENSMSNEREICWISHFNSFNPKYGYNATTGGNQHFELSAETCRKISEAHKGKVLSFEHRQKLREANTGKPFTEERCKNISAGKCGIPQPKFRKENNPERAKQISERLKGKPLSEKHKHATSEGLKRYMASRGEWHPSEEARLKMSITQKIACVKRDADKYVESSNPDAQAKRCPQCNNDYLPKKLTLSYIKRHQVKRFCTRRCALTFHNTHVYSC